MSVAYHIQIEGADEADAAVCGGTFADNIEDFDERLGELGLPPLLAFYFDPDDLDDEDDDDDDEEDDEDGDADDFDPDADDDDEDEEDDEDDDDGADEWFDPEEGLASIDALIADIESGDLAVSGEPESALKDLRGVKALLEKAKAGNRGWRLRIDF